MGIRDQINRRPGAVSIAAVLVVGLIIAAAVYKFHRASHVAAPDNTLYYFYQPDEGTLLGLPTPVSPAQHQGKEFFRAYVFSCGNCSDAQSRFIGYIEKYSAERAEREARLRQGMQPGEDLPPVARQELQALGGHEISLATPLQWLDANSEQAHALMDQLRARCPQQLTPCHPAK
jgi:hypothetical protein